MSLTFEPGQELKRSSIHDQYGGSRQSGVSPSAKYPAVFIFTGDSGELYGYADEWKGDFFHYTGEGQTGDMVFNAGNKAIRDHLQDGRELHLFRSTKKTYVEYVSQLEFVDYEYFVTPDRDGRMRKGIRFILGRVIQDGELLASIRDSASRQYDAPSETARTGLVTSRVGQGWYRQELLKRYDHKCAVTKIDLEELLVASHIVPWREATDQERLDPDNGILLSVNYDALFDRHLISFDASGNLMPSPYLSSHAIRALGIDLEAKITVTPEMEKYLEQHREHLRL